MYLMFSIGLVVAIFLYVLVIRTQDLPYVEPHSPTGHLDERKAAIYENIRDANFEFLMGKLSQEDYQLTKADLQQELNDVNAEIQKVLKGIAGSTETRPASASSAVQGSAPSAKGKHSAKISQPAHPGRYTCGNCGVSFAQPMKFCGECGHPMGDARA